MGPQTASKARIQGNRGLLERGRNAVRLVVGLLTRHNTLRRHLGLICAAEDDRCRKYDLEEESSFHILCEGDAFAGVRQRILDQAYLDAAN